MSVLCSRTMLVCATLLCAIATSHSEEDDKYCQVQSCKKKRAVHTLCNYNTTTPAAACGQSWSTGVSDSDKKTILDVHNQLRSRVAVGQEKRGDPGPQPSASNMQRLGWDDEMAIIAQRWASQCNFNHDQCRDVSRFTSGQNIFSTSSTCGSKGPNWASAINSWYDEVKKFDKSDVGNYKFDPRTGHYTQVVWADTTLVGCGYINYKNNKWCVNYYVCNYGPSGNWVGQPVYKEGKPRSNCPSNEKPDSRYPGLC